MTKTMAMPVIPQWAAVREARDARKAVYTGTDEWSVEGEDNPLPRDLVEQVLPLLRTPLTRNVIMLAEADAHGFEEFMAILAEIGMAADHYGIEHGSCGMAGILSMICAALGWLAVAAETAQHALSHGDPTGHITMMLLENEVSGGPSVAETMRQASEASWDAAAAAYLGALN